VSYGLDRADIARRKAGAWAHGMAWLGIIKQGRQAWMGCGFSRGGGGRSGTVGLARLVALRCLLERSAFGLRCAAFCAAVSWYCVYGGGLRVGFDRGASGSGGGWSWSFAHLDPNYPPLCCFALVLPFFFFNSLFTVARCEFLLYILLGRLELSETWAVTGYPLPREAKNSERKENEGMGGRETKVSWTEEEVKVGQLHARLIGLVRAALRSTSRRGSEAN